MDGRIFTPVKTSKTENNLDICLKSIFKNQLRFQIENKETNFIQTAIETLVEELVRAIDIHAGEEKDRLIAEFLLQHEEYVFVCSGTQTGLNILRAGSFYEGTKNVYPDEFDYMYVLCTFEVRENFGDEFNWLKHYFTLNAFHETIKDVLTRVIETDNFIFYDNENNRGNVIYFDGYSRTQGPASKLMFKYEVNDTADAEEKTIFVDVVPAFKIIDERLNEKISVVCDVKAFAEDIIATGSYLITNEVSFTGTEVRFMRKKLSATHKKAYRLLKYIFNGDNDGEKLRKWVPKAGISSYMIKVAVIHHHFICRYGNIYDTKPAQCVLTILEDILQFCIDYENKDSIKLKKFHGGEFEMQRDNVAQTINYLDKMIKKLQLLQSNVVESKHLKPISKSILDYIQMQTSTGHISANSSRRHSVSSQSSIVRSTSLASFKRIGKMTDDTTDDRVGISVNTHAITPSYRHRHRGRQYKIHDNSFSRKANEVVGTNVEKKSTNRKRKLWCCSLM